MTRNRTHIVKLPSAPTLAREYLDRRADLLVATHPAADELSHTLLRLAQTLRELEPSLPDYSEALLRRVEQLRQSGRRSLQPARPH